MESTRQNGNNYLSPKLPLLCCDPSQEEEEEEEEPLIRSQDIMCLNVGGKQHWALARNFANFPNTRLGKLARAKDEEEVLNWCDKYWKGDRFNEYFFDISWVGFNSILDVYRYGSLHWMNGACALVTKMDLEYWGIDEILIEPCCALKYHTEIESCMKEVEGEEESKKKHKLRKLEEDFGPSRLGRVRKYLWNLVEYPETSRAAQVVAFFSLFVIVISTVCFVLSTFHDLQEDEAEKVNNNRGAETTTTTANETRDYNATAEEEEANYNSIKITLYVIDVVTISYFMLEYAIRLACCPKKLKFFFKPMNFIDFLAILPYVISVLLESLQDLQVLGKAGKIMRLVRMMRILRIFKLVRHFAGLQSLLHTLKLAYKELGMLIVIVAVAVLTFSSLVFYAEKDSVKQWTFLDSFWWGLMTLTTVGYGTQSPQSLMGKAIGCCCAVIGVFILTLPVPIVVNSFASYYKHRLCRNKVATMRRLQADEQNRLLKEEILLKRRKSSYAGSRCSAQQPL